MQIPLEIKFRNLEPSDALRQIIEEKVAKLEKLTDDMISCKVIVEVPHKHKLQGRLFKVAINITLPRKEIAASASSDENHAYEDAYVVVRDAFEAARKQVNQYMSKRRGDVKSHEFPQHGKVVRIEPEENYGVIKTVEGREIYFHRNSVLDESFDKLQIGAEVHFNEEMGEEGPQASTVHVEGKHHLL